jgi:ferredoxin-type protein NapH
MTQTNPPDRETSEPSAMSSSAQGTPVQLSIGARAQRWWRRRTIVQLRPWVQALFTALWLLPLRFKQAPTCVFHCDACPLAGFACPIGTIARFSAAQMLPLLTVGLLVIVGMAVGSLVCGWACPFGFLQDMLAKIPTPKFRLPNWLGLGRYVVLLTLVIWVPLQFGQESPLYICSLCPAGGLEASLPRAGMAASAGEQIYWMSPQKAIITGVILVAALFVHRPWCSVLCPLGGLLALFNRFSLFYLRFEASGCSECNLCRSRCKYGVKVDQSINNTSCIRCLECTACPGVRNALAPRRVDDA